MGRRDQNVEAFGDERDSGKIRRGKVSESVCQNLCTIISGCVRTGPADYTNRSGVQKWGSSYRPVLAEP